MTHVGGRSCHVNRPAIMNHTWLSVPTITHIGWDGTVLEEGAPIIEVPRHYEVARQTLRE
jgi:hypothetical protein